MTEPFTDVPAVASERATPRLLHVLYSDTAWVIVGLVLGAADAFVGRHAMNPDGLSYVELAQTSLRVGLHGLVNAFWSPGYPALIALAFRLARPGIATEFPVVHGLNFVIFAATLFLWRALLRSWVAEPDRGATGRWRHVRSPLIPLGFGIFLLITLDAVSPSLATPDLAVLATALLIALCLQRLQTSGSWAAACSLGASCALGFWMKTVMFPLGAALLVLLVAFPPPVSRARSKVFTAGAVWLLMSLPLIAVISAKVGRPSYGETGRLNYAWYVLHTAGVEAPAPYSPSLVHPPHVLLANPRIIEFGSPIPGTFPLHYDPSYWAEGLASHFVLQDQLHAVAVNAAAYMEWLLQGQALLLMLIGLAVNYRKPRRSGRPSQRSGVLLVWSLLWLGLYGAVYVEPRYMAAASLLLVTLVVRKLLRGVSNRAAMGVAAVLAGFVLFKAASLGKRTVGQWRDHRQPEYLQLADRLGALDLKPTTRLAIVGTRDGFDGEFAHAAGLRIVAAIVDSSNSMAITNAVGDTVRTALAQAGIRAIVIHGPPLGFAESEWRRIELDDGTVANVLFTRQ